MVGSCEIEDLSFPASSYLCQRGQWNVRSKHLLHIIRVGGELERAEPLHRQSVELLHQLQLRESGDNLRMDLLAGQLDGEHLRHLGQHRFRCLQWYAAESHRLAGGKIILASLA